MPSKNRLDTLGLNLEQWQAYLRWRVKVQYTFQWAKPNQESVSGGPTPFEGGQKREVEQ